ncbi:hypothetical protein B0H19DRAFT_1075075 [Mycena capillaripes]|nr:hypothetical protein B0H19DRAFT_1075075 [Mycena capillaripes]
MAGTAAQILLEPASLYVATTQLAEAKFHWALIETDTACSATRHHWHEKPHLRGLAEGYGFQRIQPKSLTGRVVLGYFKIRGYTPPSESNGDDGTFAEICESTFQTSYATVVENRHHGLTCRTWVLQVFNHVLPPKDTHIRFDGNGCMTILDVKHFIAARKYQGLVLEVMDDPSWTGADVLINGTRMD